MEGLASSDLSPQDHPCVCKCEDVRLSLEFSSSTVCVGGRTAPTTQHVHRYLRAWHEPELEDYFHLKERRHARRRLWMWDMFWFQLWSLITITATLQTVVVAALAVGATVLFIHFRVATDLPLTILITIIVFPISVAIAHNFTRREAALMEIGTLKALALAIFFGARYWPDPHSKHVEVAVEGLRKALGGLLLRIQSSMLHNTASGELENVYEAFNEIDANLCHIVIADPSFKQSGLFVCLVKYFKDLMKSWEKLRVMHDYRTPSAIRAYGFVWLSLSSVVLAPQFAKYSIDFGYMAGIYCAILCSLLYSALYRIYSNEEDPFDGFGVDALSLEPLAKVAAFTMSPTRESLLV